MSKLSTIIDELAANGSTNTKKAILQREVNNEVLKNALWLTEDKRFNFYIRVPKTPFVVSGDREIDVALLQDVLSTLHERRLTGNAARDWVDTILSELTPEDQIIFRRIINRDLECGTGTGLINATWKGLVREMPCMLAEKLNEKTVKNIREVGPDSDPSIVVQVKYDGLRAHFSVDADGNVTAYTRSGNVIELHGLFDHIFKKFTSMVFDGELLVMGKDGHEDRATGNGFGNKAVRGTITPEEADRFSFIAWDVIPAMYFWSGETYNVPYKTRFADLQEYVSRINTPKVISAETKYCRTIAEAMAFYKEQINKGLEGAIIKEINMPWENARSKYMLKLKEILDCTLRCVGVKPHSKNPNWIGSLELESSDKQVFVSSGSGLTEEDRQRPASHFVGRLVNLEYNALIKARGSKTYSLFLPIYKNVRLDVSEADDLNKFL